MKKRIYTYKKLEYFSDVIVTRIKLNGLTSEEWRFDGILVITRGGMVPGYMLAARLGIKLIRSIAIESYSADNQRHDIRELDEQNYYFDTKKNWLIVDDISDTGNSLKFVIDKYFTDENKFKVATIVMKPETGYIPDVYATLVPQDNWIVFPYEID